MSATLTAIVQDVVSAVDDHDHRRVQRDTSSGLLVAVGGPTRTAADVARLAYDE